MTAVFVLLALVALSLPLGPPAQAAPIAVQVQATALQLLPGQQSSEAWAINGNGEVVGSSGDHAVKWVDGKATALPTPPQTSDSLTALGLNNTGTVVGRDGFEQFCVWGPDGANCHGTPRGFSAYAADVNDAGLIVGGTDDETADRAWYWDPATADDVTLIEPVLYDGSDPSSSGTRVAAVNVSGQIAGTTYSRMEYGSNGADTTEAFVWTNDAMQLLQAPEGAHSSATDLNDDGVVVGSIDSVAAMWVDGQASILGTLGGSSSHAHAINNRGQVVGISETADGQSHAFLWQDGVMAALETATGPVSGPASGQLYDLNDHGQMVGQSWDGQRWTATLWSLPPSPPAAPSPTADDAAPADVEPNDAPADDAPVEDAPAGSLPGEDSPPAVQPNFRPSPFDGDPATTERIEAASARSQAVAVSQIRFTDDGAGHVVLSRDDLFADSLAGTSLLRDGPMLLVAPSELPAQTSAELDRVLPEGGRVYLLGGADAIQVPIEAELISRGYDVARLSGASRVETSVAVAEETLRLNPDAADLVIARSDTSGDDPTAAWADSVTGGAWTASTRSPIVLTPTAEIHPAVAALISSMGPSRTVLLGGSAALSVQVERSVPNPQRLGGADRAATAALIARELWSGERERYVVINGYQHDGWAHGLPAAGLSADAQAPLLVSQDTSVPGETLSQASAPCGRGARIDVLLAGASRQLTAEVALQLDRADGGACTAR